MKPLKTIASILLGLGMLSTATPVFASTDAKNVDAIKAALDMMHLNNNFLKSTKKVSGDLWDRVRSGFQMTEVNPELVRKHEQYYASRAEYFNRTLERGSRYLHFIMDEVEKRGMPTEIALLPVIESAFVTQAKSHVGASGLWQFMPATGTQYGLEQTWWYDGRRDIYESTKAALDYLEYLYQLQGDWALALASYNWGEGRVKRAVNQTSAAGMDPVYDNLRMPNETRNYVPKLLAVRNLINDPESFGLHLNRLSDKPYFTAVSVDKHMDIDLAARMAGISEEEFKQLNPGFNLPVFAYKDGRKMLLPVDKVKTFKQNLSKWGDKPLMNWEVYTAQGNENIATLASDAGMSLNELKSVNGIKGNALQAGRPVLLASNNAKNYGFDQSRMLAQNNPATSTSNTDILVKINKPTVEKADPISLLAQTKTTSLKTAVPVSVAPSKSAGIDQESVVLAAAQPLPSKQEVITPLQTKPVNTEQKPVVTAAAQPKQVNTSPEQTAAATTETIALAQATTENIKAKTEQMDSIEHLAQSLIAQVDLTAVEEPVVQKPVVAQAAPAAKSVARVKARENTEQHKVEKNETLYAIAKQYDMTVDDLMALNNLKEQKILAGMSLKVSGDATSNNGKAAAKTNTKQMVYVVQKGDSWYSIAKKFGLSHEDIQKFNSKRNVKLQPGQRVDLIGL